MAPRYTLSFSDIVIRGCAHEPAARLLESMRAHFRLPTTPGEWGLSVDSMPGGTEAAILRAARQLRQSHYRVASVRALHDLSDDRLGGSIEEWMDRDHLSVQWDHNAHALILSLRAPTLELATAIAATFGPPKVNPYYDERKRSHARR